MRLLLSDYVKTLQQKRKKSPKYFYEVEFNKPEDYANLLN
jgi:hypothetical protein